MKKQKLYQLVFTIVIAGILATGIMCQNTVAEAKEIKGKETGYGCQSGNYIYYAFEMQGVRMGIQRYDIKTKTNKEVFSYEWNGEGTNGFYHISVKGNYIYAEWDLNMGTSSSRSYIYRISKDGTESKRLVCGTAPVIIGNRIYYEKCKLVSNEYEKYTVATGEKYSMKLDGTDIKKSPSVKLKKLSGDSYQENKTDVINGCRYYIKGKSLYQETVKTGSEKKIMSCSVSIQDFYVCGDYILVQGMYQSSREKGGTKNRLAAYLVKTNGKEKKRLRSWVPAE